MRLADVKIGTAVRVIIMHMPEPARQRLAVMGLAVGTVVVPRWRAPLGDPVMFDVLDLILALRRADAELIEVTPL